MKKYWVALLLAIAATQAVASEKEYTYRRCDESATLQNCDKCKDEKNEKISYKVSKELKSVMQTYTTPDGVSHADVIDNCKIFNENNFQCETKTAATYESIPNNGTHIDYGSTQTLTVANGKWDYDYIDKGFEVWAFKAKGIEYKRHKQEFRFTKHCGYEIKNVFNFFK